MKYIYLPFIQRWIRPDPRIQRLGIVLACGAVLFDGSYSALAKGLSGFMSPITLLVASEGLTAFFVLLTIGMFPLLRYLKAFPVKCLVIASVIGVLNSGLAPLLWYSGLAQTTAVNASMLSAAGILFTLSYGRLFLGERVNKLQVIGASIVLIGIGEIAIGGSNESIAAHVGDVFILLASATFSLGTILFKKYLSKVHPEAALFIRCITGLCCIAVVSVFTNQAIVHEISTFPAHKILSLVAFAFFARFLNLTFLYASLDRIEATKVALIQNAGPLSGMLFATLILGETIHSYHILGAIFILFGLMLEHVSVEGAARIKHNVLKFDASYPASVETR